MEEVGPTPNPEGLRRREPLCSRLGIPIESSARQVLSTLARIASEPLAGNPRFVDDHFSDQDYFDAMQEFLADPSIRNADREEAARLLSGI